MITTDAELTQATRELARLYDALAALRRGLGQDNPRSFSLLAEGPLSEIQRIRVEIDEYTGAKTLAFNEAELWLSLRGDVVRWGETPSSVVTAFLDSLRKGVQAIAESIRSGRFGVRPTELLKRACDFEVVQLQPGSLQIGLRLPEEARMQEELLHSEGTSVVLVALDQFVSAAEWVATGGSATDLAQRFESASHRRHVLRALKPFVPRARGAVDQVEIFGRLVTGSRRILLTREATQRIDKAFEDALEPTEEHFVGTIREIDLDNRTFRLRGVEGVGELICFYGDDLGPVAQSLLDRKVIVVGTRRVHVFGQRSNRVDLDEIAPSE